MSMQELPDDQLDGLFRKSLEESEPPYDAAAWQAMQTKLTEHDRYQLWQRWVRRGLPIGLLVLLPVSIWLLTRNGPTNAVSDRNPVSTGERAIGAQVSHAENEPHKHVVARLPADTVDGGSTRSASVLPEPPLPASRRPAVALTGGRLAQPARPASEQPVVASAGQPTVAGIREKSAIPVERTRSGGQTNPVADDRLSASARTARSVRRSGRTDKTFTRRSRFDSFAYARTVPSAFTEQPGDRSGATTDDAEPVPASTEPEQERFRLALQPLTSHAPTAIGQPLPIGRAIVAPESEKPVRQPSAGRVAGLSVRMLVSPDLSTIGLTNFSRPGTNVGLMVEYQLQRWHIQAGVLRSIKVYQASESKYENQATSQWPVVPNSIGGRCNMLDIPINLRYDVALLPRRRALPPSRWFVSGGMTTYYMLREEYTYNYDDPADPRIKYRDWSTETGRYGFSQLNVSAGYERAITQRLFWQVEPFLKVPLRGVGFYKVNLLSTGAFFSLRYRL